MIRTIIIDDEPSAVSVLTILLEKKCGEDVTVIAASNSPLEGKQLINDLKPDLVFLDIEMPGMTGIDLLRSIENPKFKVVFVTAYDAYAVEAFELSAIDYLLKPIGADKVERVVSKIKEETKKHQAILDLQLQQLEKFLNQNGVNSEKKIALGMSDKIIYVNLSEILYCEANGPYTNVFLRDGRNIVTSRALGDFESQLNRYHFFRIHHSYIINLNKIKEFQRHDGGYVMMENNIKLEVSQRKRKDFLDTMNDFVI